MKNFYIILCAFLFGINSYAEPINTKNIPKSNPVGTYLTDGGMSYIKIREQKALESVNYFLLSVSFFIKKNETVAQEKWLEFKSDYIFRGYSVPFGLVNYNNKTLELKYYYDGYYDDGSGKDSANVIFKLIPSELNPQDWDLIEIGGRYIKDKKIKISPPIKSFLHRINNKKIEEYFESYNANYQGNYVWTKPSKAMENLEIGKYLIKRYPDDLHVRTIYFNTLIAVDDYDSLQKEIDSLKGRYEKRDEFALKETLYIGQRALYGAALSRAGANAYDFLEKCFSKNTDMQSRLKMFSEINKYKEYIKRESLLISDSYNYFNSLEYSITPRVIYLYSLFNIIQGKKDEALNLLLSCLHFGRLLRQDIDFTPQWISVEITKPTIKGLKDYLYRCCNSPAELKDFIRRINETCKISEDIDFYKLISLKNSLSAYITNIIVNPEFFGNLELNMKINDATIQLLNVAAASKHYYLTKGKMPENEDSLKNYFKNGFLKDVFGENEIHFYSSQDSFSCYSIGPDGKDDGGKIAYSPTNGLNSDGDIIMDIPSFNFKKKIPKNEAELKEYFSEGMPNDIFVNNYGMENNSEMNSSIRYFSDKDFMTIYSIGPDGGDSKAIISYDPTNGVTSSGDIFINIPLKEGKN